MLLSLIITCAIICSLAAAFLFILVIGGIVCVWDEFRRKEGKIEEAIKYMVIVIVLLAIDGFIVGLAVESVNQANKLVGL